jgi:histidine triad (HIT) family protein
MSRIDTEHAIAFAADAPAAKGHIVVVPKEYVPSIHALPIAAQKGVWALVSEVRGRLRTGLVPDGWFIIGFLDGLTAAVPVPHAVIQVLPRRAGDRAT